MSKKNGSKKHQDGAVKTAAKSTLATVDQAPHKMKRKAYELARATAGELVSAIPRWSSPPARKIVIVFEGHDAAGEEGAPINQIVERCHPRVFPSRRPDRADRT